MPIWVLAPSSSSFTSFTHLRSNPEYHETDELLSRDIYIKYIPTPSRKYVKLL